MWCRFLLRAFLTLAVVASVTLAFGSTRAQAMIEFCPARLVSWAPAGEASDAPRSRPTLLASDYTFRLQAYSSRIVSGTVAIGTDTGWYQVTVPATPLSVHVVDYRSDSQRGETTNFRTTLLQVHFPSAVHVAEVFLAQATAIHDGPFGWEPRGSVTCDPVGDPHVDAARRPASHHHDRLTLTFVDRSDPSERPIALAPPTRLDPPTGLDCPVPFADARVTTLRQPGRLDNSEYVQGVANVTVAIDARGTAVDAWLQIPSPSRAVDKTAIEAAMRTRYQPAVAFCRNVPGIYTFRYDVLEGW